MGYKQITDLNADVIVSIGGTNRNTGKKNPTEVEGYYLGKREVADQKKKSGISYIYFFQTAKGNVGVWGKTDMDRKLNQAVVGHMTKVAFDRMVKVPNGEMYKYTVAQDDANSIEVVLQKTTTADLSDDSDHSDDSEGESYLASIESKEKDDEEGLQILAMTPAQRKAKLLEVLKSKGQNR